jgi:hypothetical protein
MKRELLNVRINLHDIDELLQSKVLNDVFEYDIIILYEPMDRRIVNCFERAVSILVCECACV